ncbi:hypothetical protein IFM89_028047 [Coptis chinensis]|uniref:Uncharacterized protein n=1 Tax=Coptis chinensis TaxID=261450 RepID=A0A835HG09_9MAGN|nr:hypothetical protein IFM89_028047 [Coptis chinensis]
MKRGTTIMIELNKKWDGNKIRVVYDEKGKPNNRVVRRKLAGMEGALARSKKEEFDSSVEHDDRSVKWLRARQKKNGEFVNDATMEIAKRIAIKCSLALRSKGNIVAKGLLFKKTDPKYGTALWAWPKEFVIVGDVIKDFGVVAKSKKALPNFAISTPQEKEETLDEMERSIREYGDMLDNTMESSDNIVIPIERELFGEEIELGHFSIEKSDLLDICSMD